MKIFACKANASCSESEKVSFSFLIDDFLRRTLKKSCLQSALHAICWYRQAQSLVLKNVKNDDERVQLVNTAQ